MEQIDKNVIYDRLLAINIKLDPSPTPDPAYINRMIWDCHRYIEEVEAYNIRITRELSVRQQALNNATADYQTKLEGLITGDMIRVLPNIKDRVGEANKKLTNELKLINDYTNELADLNNLLGAVNLKLKNLNRANSDVGKQIRVMESQIKLSVAPKGDPMMADMAMEMAKGASGQDMFEGSTSEIDSSESVDPTTALDVDRLLGPDDEPPLAPVDLSSAGATARFEMAADNLSTAETKVMDTDGLMDIDSLLASEAKNPPAAQDTPPVATQAASDNLPSDDPAPAPNPEANGYVPGESDIVSNQFDGTPAEDEEPFELTTEEETSSSKAGAVIDLDKVLENPESSTTQGGASDTTPNIVPETKAATAAVEQKVEPQKEPEQAKQKISGGIDLDDLLDNIS